MSRLRDTEHLGSPCCALRAAFFSQRVDQPRIAVLDVFVKHFQLMGVLPSSASFEHTSIKKGTSDTVSAAFAWILKPCPTRPELSLAVELALRTDLGAGLYDEKRIRDLILLIVKADGSAAKSLVDLMGRSFGEGTNSRTPVGVILVMDVLLQWISDGVAASPSLPPCARVASEPLLAVMRGICDRGIVQFRSALGCVEKFFGEGGISYLQRGPRHRLTGCRFSKPTPPLSELSCCFACAIA